MKRNRIVIGFMALAGLIALTPAGPLSVVKHSRQQIVRSSEGRSDLPKTAGRRHRPPAPGADFYTHDVGVTGIVSPQGYVAAGTYAPVAIVRNFGTVKEHSFNVLLTITGGYASSKTIDSLASGETLAVTFNNWAVSQIGTYAFKCSTAVANDSDRTNNYAYGMAAIPDWIVNFESDNGGFQADPVAQAWAWGAPSSPRPGAHSGTKLWAAPIADTYPNYEDWRLSSPAYVATQSDPVIGFWHWYDCEYSYDGGNLKYSTDDGQNWELIEPWGPYAREYDCYVDGLSDDGYSENDTTWRLAWFRVPVAAGQSFRLLWEFGSDVNVTFLGWMFDDVAGIHCTRLSQDVGAGRISAPPGIIAPGTYTPKAWVHNYGIGAVGSFDVHFTISGGYQNTRIVSSLAPGESVEVTFSSWNVSDTGLYFLECSTALAGDQNPAGDARLGLSAIPHGFSDFEAGNGGLMPDTPTSGWNWGTPGPGRGTHSGSRVWGAPLADTYPPYAAWWLRSPLLVSVQDNPAASFWHRYEFEPEVDHGQFYYTRENNYPYLLYPWEPYSRPYDDGDGYSRRDPQWRQAWFKVPVTARTPVTLRWYLGSSGLNNFQGWLVDDFARIGLRLARHRDVGVRWLYAPTDTILGDSLRPYAEVDNLGLDRQSFRTTVLILDSAGGQCCMDTARVDTLASASARSIYFATWSGPPYVGRYTAICYTSLAGDSAPDNDTFRRTVFAVSAPPVLVQPSYGSTIYTGLPLFRWDSVPGATRYDLQVFHDHWPRTDTLINKTLLTQTSFLADTFLPENSYKWRARAWVGGYGSRWSDYYYFTARPASDVSAAAVVSPTGGVDTSAVIAPQARVANYGLHATDFPVWFCIDSAGHPVYSNTVQVLGLAAGAQRVITFTVWAKPHTVGSYATRCSTMLVGDTNPVNNRCTGSFTVTLPVVETGWVRKADVPLGAKAKNVTLGGALAYLPLQSAESPDGTRTTDAGGSVFAFKGTNRCEFYRYNVDDNTWVTKESIPAVGRTGKKKTVKKGASLGTADGKLYATKGSNSLEFWRYDPSAPSSPWTQLADILPGEKNVKEGAGMTSVVIADTTWIYFLKGSATEEFYRYNTVSNTWYMLPDAPDGESGKPYRNGSGITYDPDRNVIYALKNSVSEFFRYFIDSNFWRERASLPLVGSSGKKKRVGSGAGIAFCSGNAYALKGNGNVEFWRYSPDSDRWTQSSDMPLGGGKKPKGGGGLAAAADALYALKGNNTLEFYRYGLSTDRPAPNDAHLNVMSDSPMPGRPTVLAIAPNPFSGTTTISFTLPVPAVCRLTLYDVTGRLVTMLANGHRNAGHYALRMRPDATPLASGVYLLKLEVRDPQHRILESLTRKLIIE
jgi:hypothetical protein